MADDQIVNEEQTSTEEIVSPEAEPQPQPQPLTRGEAEQLIAEQLGAAKEAGRREMQGIKDREVGEAQRRARFAEDSLARIRGRYADLDPEARQALEAEEMRGQLGYYQSREAQTVQRDQMMATVNAFEGNISQFITDVGIDPNDKRIDWGDRNSMNLTQRQDTILKSVAKIQKENTKASEGKVSQTIKEEIAKARKELGLDTVDTSTPAAPGEDLSKLSSTDLIARGLKEGAGKKRK